MRLAAAIAELNPLGAYLMHYLKLFIITLFVAASIGVDAQPATTNVTFAPDGRDWIYRRHMDVSYYLIRHADISEKERMLHRRQAHSSYFEYWLLHRSARRTLTPVAAYEAYFSKLLRKDVLPHVDVEDPLQIRKLYSDGKCKDTRLIAVEVLTGKDLERWETYQGFVSQFRAVTGTTNQTK